jgi:hypothetical protein
MQSAKTEKQWLKVMDAMYLRIARDLICIAQAAAQKNCYNGGSVIFTVNSQACYW